MDGKDVSSDIDVHNLRLPEVIESTQTNIPVYKIHGSCTLRFAL